MHLTAALPVHDHADAPGTPRATYRSPHSLACGVVVRVLSGIHNIHMCWTAEVSFAFAGGEAVAMAYAYWRNKHFDRQNVLMLLPVMLQELVQGLLWPYVTANRDDAAGWDDPALHSCPRANRAYSFLIAIIVCGIPTWFEQRSRAEMRAHNALLEMGEAPPWRKLMGELPTLTRPTIRAWADRLCLVMTYVLILAIFAFSLTVGGWGPANCTTRGRYGHQVWAMMVWPRHWQQGCAALLYFACGGAFAWVPRPSIVVPLLGLPLALLAVLAYFFMGPEAGSVWCWSASCLCIAMLAEPAVVDAVRLVERAMVDFSSSEPEAVQTRAKVRNNPLAFVTFNLCWNHCRSLGGAGDRRPWRAH